jgi:hypothetical protein
MAVQSQYLTHYGIVPKTPLQVRRLAVKPHTVIFMHCGSLASIAGRMAVEQTRSKEEEWG